MMNGFIYVLSNKSFSNGRLKIGMAKDVPSRAKDLFTTGVPEPFTIEYLANVENYEKVEKLVHSRLRHKRGRMNREYFLCSIPEAINAIQDIAKINYEKIYYKSPEEIRKHRLKIDLEKKKIEEEERKKQEKIKEDKEKEILRNKQIKKWNDAKEWSHELYKKLYFEYFQEELNKIENYKNIQVKPNAAYGRHNPNLLLLIIMYFLVVPFVAVFVSPILILISVIIGILHIRLSSKELKVTDQKIELIEEKARIEIRKFCDDAYEKLITSNNPIALQNQLLIDGHVFVKRIFSDIT